MKGLKTFAVLLLSLSVALTACGSEKGTDKGESNTTSFGSSSNETAKGDASKETENVETKTYEGEGFSFAYPASWKVPEMEVPAATVAFVNPDTVDKFRDNINLVVEDSAVPANEAAELTVSQLSGGGGGDLVKDYKKIDYRDAPASGSHKTAGVLKSEYTQGQSGTQVILTQYFVSTGKKLYSLSVTYSKKSYESGGEKTVQAMIDSFKVTEATETTEADNASDQAAAGSTDPAQTTKETRTADMMSLIVQNMIEDGAIDPKTYNYIIEHNELFPATNAQSKKAAGAEVDSKITSRHLFKNITPYLDKMVEVSGYVVEVTEEEIAQGTTLAEIHIIDENDNSIVGIYASSTGDILDGDIVTMRGVPTAQYAFDNVSGGTTNAVLLTVSSVKKAQ